MKPSPRETKKESYCQKRNIHKPFPCRCRCCCCFVCLFVFAISAEILDFALVWLTSL